MKIRFFLRKMQHFDCSFCQVYIECTKTFWRPVIIHTGWRELQNFRVNIKAGKKYLPFDTSSDVLMLLKSYQMLLVLPTPLQIFFCYTEDQKFGPIDFFFRPHCSRSKNTKNRFKVWRRSQLGTPMRSWRRLCDPSHALCDPSHALCDRSHFFP